MRMIPMILIFGLSVAQAAEKKVAQLKPESTQEEQVMEKMNTAPTPVPSTANESPKSEGAILNESDWYPIGPYNRDGNYAPTTGEERQAEEERLLHDRPMSKEKVDRLNKMGPNKW